MDLYSKYLQANVCMWMHSGEWTNIWLCVCVCMNTPACEYTCLVSSQVLSPVLSAKATPSNVTRAWRPMRTTATDRAPPPALSTLTPAPPSQDPVSKHKKTCMIWLNTVL